MLTRHIFGIMSACIFVSIPEQQLPYSSRCTTREGSQTLQELHTTYSTHFYGGGGGASSDVSLSMAFDRFSLYRLLNQTFHTLMAE